MQKWVCPNQWSGPGAEVGVCQSHSVCSGRVQKWVCLSHMVECVGHSFRIAYDKNTVCLRAENSAI